MTELALKKLEQETLDRLNTMSDEEFISMLSTAEEGYNRNMTYLLNEKEELQQRLIIMADTFKEADGYVAMFYHRQNDKNKSDFKQKLEYVISLFPEVQIMAATDSVKDSLKSDENDYIAVLSTIVNQKRR